MEPEIRRLVLRIGGAVIIVVVFFGGMYMCSGRSKDDDRKDAIRSGCVAAGHAPTDSTHQRCKDLSTERCKDIVVETDLRDCAKKVGDELFGRKP